MHRVIHLLPYSGIGGAEAAARSMTKFSSEQLDFQLRWIYPEVRTADERWHTYNPVALPKATRGVLKDKPDLLIVSLWRACIVGILVRLFRPKTQLVVLIHNSVDAHWLDYFFTRWAMAWSSAIWADSAASVRLRFGDKAPATTIIPFLTRHLKAPLVRDADQGPTPTFIYWGRLAPQKNLTRALELFHRIWRVRPEARFTVIGPGVQETLVLHSVRDRLGLMHAVRFKSAMKFLDITAEAELCAFYLQTSNYEGMSLSVVESMQLGLVPVVTPVGEIGSYCRDGENAVLVESDEKAAETVLRLLEDPQAYERLRRNAIQTWQGKPIYRDVVIAACTELLRR